MKLQTKAGCFFVFFCGAIFSTNSIGHHSRAEFSSEIRVIEGSILSVHWRNPHPQIMLRVLDDAGQQETWDIAVWGAANLLNRLGVTGDLLNVGDRVKVAGQVSSRREYYFQGTNLLLPGGLELILQPNLMPRWSPQRFVGNRVQHSLLVSQSQSRLPEGNVSGIFRVWTPIITVSGRGFDGRDSDSAPSLGFSRAVLPLTPSAEEKKRNWDPEIDNPILRCQAPGMPGAMSTPHPIEFEQGPEGIILLHLEEWDLTRIIYMAPQLPKDDDLLRPLGYSVGNWDGNTLLVMTTGIDYPYSIWDGVPQSRQTEIAERFSFEEDQRTLSWEATIVDPETFTEPLTVPPVHWKWVPGEEIQPYNCSLGPE